MNRKRLTTLLCLLLVAMLPITALAAVTERTIDISMDNENYADVPAVTDLLETMTIKVISGEQADGSSALVLNLGGTDVLTIAARVDVTGLFLQTDALDNDPLYFSWDDLITMSNASGALSDSDVEMLQTIRQALKNLQEGTRPKEAEQLLQKLSTILEVIQEDEESIALFAGIIDDAKVTEGTFEDAKHDTADQKIECSATTEFYSKTVETKTYRAIVEAILTSTDEPYTDEALKQEVDEMVKEAQKNYADMELNLDMTLLMAQGELVSFSGLATMNDDEEENTKKQMDIIYHRLTTGEGVNHNAELSNEEIALVLEVAQNADDSIVAACHVVEDDSRFTLQLDLMENTEDSIKAAFHVFDGNSQVTFQYELKRAEEANDHTLSMYFRENAKAIIAPNASQRPVLSYHMVSKTVENAVLEGVSNATAETAIEPLRLSVVEFETFKINASVSLQRALMRVMGYLPESTFRSIVDETR